MKQVLHSLRTGELAVVEVPEPACLPGFVLVRNAFSFISTGTERAVRESARSSLLAKARQRPDQVRKVLEKVRTEGVASAFEKVRARLEEPSPLGYSTAGIVLEVGEGVQGFHTGDRVACAGAGYANHAEIVSVPKNLVAPIPAGVSFEEACGTTLCAIALQGLRVGEVAIGEVAGVIGLGLLGQIAVQLLKASGCTVVGVDLDASMVEKAKEMGADYVLLRTDDVEELVRTVSGGHGLDLTLLCAASKSNDPIELAAKLTRKKGRIVAVGDVSMNVPRPDFYPKELELRLSTSYGPGRYDPDYEERGHDYPYAYVRFTERRNMETALSLMAEGKLRLAPLVNHRFPVDRAEDAYALVEGKGSVRPLGILFDYGLEWRGAAVSATAGKTDRVVPIPAPTGAEALKIGVIGAGQFAKGVLLPRIQKIEGVEIRRVVSGRSSGAQNVAKRLGIPYASCRAEDVYEDPEIAAVVIATRNHLHASQTIAALQAGKDVFVEKPLALNPFELEGVKEAVEASGRTAMVGFNRRFAPLAQTAKQWFEPREWPLFIHATVNAGRLERDSWLLNPEESGGRIVGEACHFVDLFQYWTGARVTRVQAEFLRGPRGLPSGEENVSAILGFADGSVGSLLYTAEGASGLPKERYEIHGGQRSAVLDDFRRLDLYDRTRRRTARSRGQDKGHSAELEHFFACLREGKRPCLSFESCVRTSEVTFEMVRLTKGERDDEGREY